MMHSVPNLARLAFGRHLPLAKAEPVTQTLGWHMGISQNRGYPFSSPKRDHKRAPLFFGNPHMMPCRMPQGCFGMFWIACPEARASESDGGAGAAGTV